MNSYIIKRTEHWFLNSIQPSIAIYSFFDYQGKSDKEFQRIKKTKRVYHQQFVSNQINQQEIHKNEIFPILQGHGKSKLKIKHLSPRHLYFI